MGHVSQTKVAVEKDLESLSQKVAEFFALEVEKVVKEGRLFSVALSGGSTPKRLYELLAERPWLPWRLIHFFWGDERCVPPDDPRSNFRMATEALFSKIDIPKKNIHRFKGEQKPEEASALYEKELRDFFKPRGNFPPFDFDILGVGTNGHTASLFPRTEALHEQDRWAVGYLVEEVNLYRMTLTVPVHNHAKQIVFLVSGEEKASVVNRILTGPFVPEDLPAQLIRPENGTLTWFLDNAAAKALQKSDVTRLTGSS